MQCEWAPSVTTGATTLGLYDKLGLEYHGKGCLFCEPPALPLSAMAEDFSTKGPEGSSFGKYFFPAYRSPGLVPGYAPPRLGRSQRWLLLRLETLRDAFGISCNQMQKGGNS